MHASRVLHDSLTFLFKCDMGLSGGFYHTVHASRVLHDSLTFLFKCDMVLNVSLYKIYKLRVFCTIKMILLKAI